MSSSAPSPLPPPLPPPLPSPSSPSPFSQLKFRKWEELKEEEKEQIHHLNRLHQEWAENSLGELMATLPPLTDEDLEGLVEEEELSEDEVEGEEYDYEEGQDEEGEDGDGMERLVGQNNPAVSFHSYPLSSSSSPSPPPLPSSSSKKIPSNHSSSTPSSAFFHPSKSPATNHLSPVRTTPSKGQKKGTPKQQTETTGEKGRSGTIEEEDEGDGEEVAGEAQKRRDLLQRLITELSEKSQRCHDLEFQANHFKLKSEALNISYQTLKREKEEVGAQLAQTQQDLLLVEVRSSLILFHPP